MRRLVFGLVALAVAGPAYAESSGPACDERASILRHLESQYEEQPVAIGVASNGGVVEVLTNKNGSTWTILITLPSGKTCLMAAGQDWEDLPEVAYGPKA